MDTGRVSVYHNRHVFLDIISICSHFTQKLCYWMLNSTELILFCFTQIILEMIFQASYWSTRFLQYMYCQFWNAPNRNIKILDYWFDYNIGDCRISVWNGIIGKTIGISHAHADRGFHLTVQSYYRKANRQYNHHFGVAYSKIEGRQPHKPLWKFGQKFY